MKFYFSDSELLPLGEVHFAERNKSVKDLKNNEPSNSKAGEDTKLFLLFSTTFFE